MRRDFVCLHDLTPGQKKVFDRALRKANDARLRADKLKGTDKELQSQANLAQAEKTLEKKTRQVGLARERNQAKAAEDKTTPKVKDVGDLEPDKEVKPKETSLDKLKSKTGTKPKPEPQQNSKVHSINNQDDFDDLMMHSFEKLGAGKDDFVPVYKLRREIGELVPRNKFNEWLKEAQANDKIELFGGSVEDSAPDKIKDSVKTALDGLRCYVRLGSEGEAALKKAATRRQELEEKLKDRPELDPLGTASQLQKGAKIQSQSDFDSVALEAHKRLDDEFNLDNRVPIADVRKAIGGRISKEEFNKMLFNLQERDQVILAGNDNASKDLLDGGVTDSLGGKRVYIVKAS